jgi:aromatic-L-amino-acid decarboxylase
VWFHVDGAFGAPAILTAGGRELLAGIEQADSLALDAHKWLFQPLEAGCMLVRDVALLEVDLPSSREFLLDAAAGDREVNFTDRGLQLTPQLPGVQAVAVAQGVRPRRVRRGLEAVNRRVADAMLVDELATLSSTVTV